MDKKIQFAVLAAVLTAIAVVVIGNLPITFMNVTGTQWEGIALRGGLDLGDVIFYAFTAFPVGVLVAGWFVYER